MTYLFVYGTLRLDARQGVARYLSRGARLVGTGYIQAKLFDLGEYPGSVLSSNPRDKVHGQIFEILDESLFSILDDYEGCGPHDKKPYEFIRARVNVVDSNSSILSAWTYLYNRPVDAHRQIRTGDYLTIS